MPAVRPWWLAILLAAGGLLSGCTSPAPGDGDGASPVPGPEEAPGEGPANGMPGHGHDLWAGGDRLVVLDAEAAVDGTGFLSGTSETFRPEPGDVVPLGTARVEVSVSWTPGPTDLYGDVELLVKTAADSDFWLAGAIENGGLTAIPTENDANDLPHQLLSGWAFKVHFHGRDDDTYVNLQSMPVQVRAEAVRGLEIPVFPPHPDRWENRTEVAILDASGDVGLCMDAAELSVDGRLLAHSPNDGQTVLPGTEEVVVSLSHEGSLPLQLGLSFHGADTFDYIPLEPTASTESTWEFRIPVSPTQADGPYARQSLWSFRVEAQDPVQGGPYSGTYSLSAAIVRGSA